MSSGSPRPRGPRRAPDSRCKLPGLRGQRQCGALACLPLGPIGLRAGADEEHEGRRGEQQRTGGHRGGDAQLAASGPFLLIDLCLLSVEGCADERVGDDVERQISTTVQFGGPAESCASPQVSGKSSGCLPHRRSVLEVSPQPHRLGVVTQPSGQAIPRAEQRFVSNLDGAGVRVAAGDQQAGRDELVEQRVDRFGQLIPVARRCAPSGRHR